MLKNVKVNLALSFTKPDYICTMKNDTINYLVLEENGLPICVYLHNTSAESESYTFYKTKHLPKEYSATKEYSPFKRAKDLRSLTFEQFREIAAKENLLTRPSTSPVGTAPPQYSE